jgi:hypothetical protein
LHRPDLVLWPIDGRLPVAVEVELTVKAPRRLSEICRAWARCRLVAGVLYLAAPDVQRALDRARRQVEAGDRIVVLGLDTFPALGPGAPALPEADAERTASTVPSGA